MHHEISGHFRHLNRDTSAGIQVQQRSYKSLLQPYTRCETIANFRCVRSGVRNEIYISPVNAILQKRNYVKVSRYFQHRTVQAVSLLHKYPTCKWRMFLTNAREQEVWSFHDLELNINNIQKQAHTASTIPHHGNYSMPCSSMGLNFR